MPHHPLFPSGPHQRLRPEQVRQAVEHAQLAGVDVADHASFQAAFAQLLNEFKQREARYAPSTLQRLDSAWGQFVTWCMQAKRPSLPAHPEDVERFFLERSADCHRHTLAVYRWAISRVHRICGCPDPCLDVYVEDRLKAITRQKVRLGEGIKQATPFNEQHLITLTEIWQDHAQIKLRRNLALLAVAYESMLRASELVRIRFADLSWQADGTAVVTIPISKTNHSGEPDTVLLSPDVVRLLKAYLHAAQLTSRPEAYVFVGVSKHNRALLPKRDPQTGTYRDRALSTKTIEGIFQAAWQELELHGESPFTAHSARVGATQDLLRKGYPTLQIQQSGRWASGTMVMRYGRAILARDSAMAKNRMAPKPHMDEE